MSMRKKKRNKSKPQKKFSVSAEKVQHEAKDSQPKETLDYGEYLEGDKIVSTDRELKSKVILHTFIGEENLKQPEEQDMFIAHSFTLAEENPNFIPWVSGEFSNNCDKIQDAISKSSCNDLKDSIKSSGIVNISATAESPQELEVN